MRSRFHKSLVAGAVLLASLAMFIAFAHTTASAQVRPALVKNVDEPGRTPWETRSQFLPNAGGCYVPTDCVDYADGSGYAVFNLRTVPAGKRWVVTSATGGLVNGDGRITNITLGNSRGGIIFDGAKWIYGGPFYKGTDFGAATFTANLFATFGPGETPVVRVTGDPNLSGYTVIVFSGYLIDATN